MVYIQSWESNCLKNEGSLSYDPTNPSQSLVKAISYPELFKFNSKSTSWGCKHEKQARQAYHEKMLESHHKFSVADAGLTIKPEWPFLGASPDGVVYCN